MNCFLIILLRFHLNYTLITVAVMQQMSVAILFKTSTNMIFDSKYF